MTTAAADTPQTAFDIAYAAGIIALKAGNFQEAITQLTAAKEVATPADNLTEGDLVENFLATAQFGLTLPAEIASDFDQLIALGNEKFTAYEFFDAGYYFDIANNLNQAAGKAMTLERLFLTCERQAQVAYEVGDTDGAIGLASVVINDGGDAVPADIISAAKALMQKIENAQEGANA